ncbi:RAF-like serine/threonine-protein kinase 20 [Carex rostrata]
MDLIQNQRSPRGIINRPGLMETSSTNRNLCGAVPSSTPISIAAAVSNANSNSNSNPQYEEMADLFGLRRSDSGGCSNSSYSNSNSNMNVNLNKKPSETKTKSNLSRVSSQKETCIEDISENNKISLSEPGQSPQSDKVKFMCSFGGKILPRPSDGKLRYVGGETRLVSMGKTFTWTEFANRTLKVFNQPHIIKYQLPGEDLDALISVSSDEDLQNMMEEYDGLEKSDGSLRLRIFLISTNEMEREGAECTPSTDYVVAVNNTVDPSAKNLSGDNLSSQGFYPSPYTSQSPPFSPGPNKNYYEMSNGFGFHNPVPILLPKMLNKVDFGNASPVAPVVTNQGVVTDTFVRNDNDLNGYHSEKCYGCTEYTPSMPHAYSDSKLHEEKTRELEFVASPLPQNPFEEHDFFSNSNLNLNLSLHHDHEGSILTNNKGTFAPVSDPNYNNTYSNLNGTQISSQDLLLLESQVPTSPFPVLDPAKENLPGNFKFVESSMGFGETLTPPVEKTVVNSSNAPPLISLDSMDVMPSLGSNDPFQNTPLVDIGLNEVLNDNNVADSIENENITSLEPVVKIEDEVTLEVPSFSGAIPHIVECAERTTSSHDFKTEGGDNEELEVDGSISDATLAEIEAGMYGLQIIRNADLEEMRELGSGTFGTVYHGKWRGSDVAIKRIKKSCFSGRKSEQDKLTKDFWREAQILSKLHHPNVVAFYGVVPDGPEGTLATVAEFMVNGSLRHVLVRKEKALDKRKRLMIAMDAACGMEYLHSKNIVHFDLKCDNLLVNLRDPHRPICKVGDFGLSRIKRNTLVSGGVRGTLPWMAPELLNGSSSKVSEKVDVFSFGIALWEILTGEEPYANMHCGTIIGGILSNTLRPPIPERCDPEWRQLMEDCWSADPYGRPSFTTITDRLRAMSISFQSKLAQNK